MQIIYILVLLFGTAKPQALYTLSTFYCGFSSKYCGQSTLDDLNSNVNFVILAFANTLSNGSIIVDTDNFPKYNVQKWQNQGKTIILSVGGQNGNWSQVFANDSTVQNFVSSVSYYLTYYLLDGVDLDIQSYTSTPAVVASAIISLKSAIGTKILIVSPQCVTIYQGSAVPKSTQANQYFNYFVPIIQLAGNSIDYFQPQAYNNWYDGVTGGTADYLKDVYLNWRNFQGLNTSIHPIANFSGVPGNKLLIGVLGSTQAGGSGYYAAPSVLNTFINFLKTNNYELKGFMIWDSYWDSLNSKLISNAIISNCIPGYLWNVTSCIIDCKLILNSIGSINASTCQCNSGFFWNASNNSCAINPNNPLSNQQLVVMIVVILSIVFVGVLGFILFVYLWRRYKVKIQQNGVQQNNPVQQTPAIEEPIGQILNTEDQLNRRN